MASNSQEGVEGEDLNDSFASTDSNRGKFVVPPLDLQSCPTFERKFIVCNDRLSSVKFYKLLHPRANRFALYQIDDTSVSEFLQIDGERSCFYGNSVVKDCTITMLSPVHPLFILLPLVLKQTSPFSLEELTTDSTYPALTLLAKIPATRKALKLACDCDKDGKFMQNEDKLFDWMESRFNMLVQAFKTYDGLPANAKESDESLRYFAFDIFTDYIPDSIANKLKYKLRIEKPLLRSAAVTPSINKTPTNKRKLDSSKKSEAKKRKVLADASKNTMKLNMFF